MMEKPSYGHTYARPGHGLTLMVNDCARPEPVLTAQQCEQLSRIADRGDR